MPSLSHILRRTTAGNVLLDGYPTDTRFYDGQTRRVPRTVHHLFQFWRDNYADECDAVYAAYEGGDMIDVGAEYGFYALLLAPKGRKGDTFVSLEPDPRSIPVMLQNLAHAAALFPDLRMCGLPFAAGNGHRIRVSHPAGDTYYAQYADADEGDAMPSCTVDDVVDTLGLRPAFVKIDVEGAEYNVLLGMERTLAAHRPKVMLELHLAWQPEGCSVEAVRGLLERFGYRPALIGEYENVVREIWAVS